MRNGCRCAGVCARSLEALLGVLRVIVRMNEIVQHTWMLRLMRADLFEKLGGLLLLRKSLGAFRNSAQDGQAIEQLRFVVWIFGVDCGHGVAIILIAH